MSVKYFQNLVKKPNELSLFTLRLIIGLMWLSEGLIKLIDRTPSDKLNDYHFFLQQLHEMADSNPIGFVSSMINNLLIPNYELFAWLVIILELFLAISLVFGILSKIGSLIGIGYTIILFFSTLGWGEWIWTYPLIATPMLIIFISSTCCSVWMKATATPATLLICHSLHF